MPRSFSWTLYRISISFVFLINAQSGATTIIDSFEGPEFVETNEDNPGSDIFIEQRTLPDVLGGSRAIYYGGIGNSRGKVSIDSGALIVDANGGEHDVTLAYGTIPTSGPPFDLALSNSDVVQVAFDYANWTGLKQLSIRISGEGRSLSTHLDLPASADPFVVSFPISEMGPSEDATAVLEGVQALRLNGPVSGPYSISEVRIVPEPAFGFFGLVFSFGCLRNLKHGGHTIAQSRF